MPIHPIKTVFKNSLLFLIFSVSLTSCSKDTISSNFNYNCNYNFEYPKLQTTKDTNGNFEIKIPFNWKKEFFMSDSETRLYFADTTRQLTEAFIIDIGLYNSPQKIEEEYLKEIKKEIRNSKNAKVTDKTITFQEKPGYILEIQLTEMNINKNSIHIYLQNKNNSYYFIKIDAYGTELINKRLCEALQILDKIEFY